jgi:hypothetical protein
MEAARLIKETNVNVTRRLVDELTDDEINRRIADFIGRGAAYCRKLRRGDGSGRA